MDRRETTYFVSDYIWRVLKKWRMMILFAVLGAIFCGSLKYFTDAKAYKSYQIQCEEQSDNNMTSLEDKKEQLLSNFSEKDRQTVENIIELEEELITQTEYKESAVISQLNPYDVKRVTLTYAVEAVSKSASICRRYSYSIFEDDAKEKIINASNGTLQKSDIVDLISVAVDDNRDSFGEEADNVQFFSVYVRGVDKESVENMAKVIQDIIAESKSTVAAEMGEHTIYKVSDYFTEGRDSTTVSTINTTDSDICTKYTQITQLLGTLTEEQKGNVKSYLDMIHLQDQDGMVVDNATSIGRVSPARIDVKRIILGLLLGIFFGCVWEGALWLLGGQINSKEEFMESVSLHSFGTMNDTNKSVKKGPIDKLIYKLQTMGEKQLSEEENYQMILSDIKLLAVEKNLQKIYITGSEEITVTDCFERMKAELHESGIELIVGESVLTSSKALCDIAESDASIIVEYIEKSKYKNIYSELSVCEKHGVTVLGSVLVG